MGVLSIVLGIVIVVAIIGFLIKSKKEKSITPTDKSIKQPNPNKGKSDRKDAAIKKYKSKTSGTADTSSLQ
jgi:FtsZ-interacting cell division protein ZipA